MTECMAASYGAAMVRSLAQSLVVDLFPDHSAISDPLSTSTLFLYFSGFGANTGRELWRTDGTAAGTTLVKDINAGSYHF